ncbi:uncharacterized protein [Ambystoma mexicanum]|uniref:uncharacterized protein isoform X2 n=1 Tax=Ambystoma mexicanum TaxID=8296 RepID=UPI0037E97FFF
MKSRKVRTQQDFEEVSHTFCDVAACFSEEEWNLLHQWQRELYTNVMKEIRQAFSSLGPLIAASVFSLKPKESEDLCSVDFQDIEMTGTMMASSSEMTAESDVLFRGDQYLKDEDTDEGHTYDRPTTGKHNNNSGNNLKIKEVMESGVIDQHGEGGGDFNAGLNLGEHIINSGNNFKIKEELVSGFINQHGEGGGESHTGPSLGPDDISPAVSFKIERVGESFSRGQPVSDNSRTSFTTYPFHNTEVDTSLMDFHFPDRRGIGICPNSGTELNAPVGINEEGVAYPMHIQDYQRESFSCPSGEAR